MTDRPSHPCTQNNLGPPRQNSPKDITAMDQQRADVSAESQLRSQAEKDSQSLALLDRPMCTRYLRNDE